VAFRVRIEKMIGARIILVNALLHQPHPEDTGVKIEVLLRRASDGSDVVKSTDVLHI
jgi:hypothetical protein